MRTAGWPILDHQILRPTRTPGNPANAPGSQSRPRPGIMWWWQAATESAISTVSMKWPLWSIRLSQLILQGSLYFPVFLGVKHHFLALKTGCMVLALQTCMLGEEVTENLRLSIASSRGHLEVVRLLLDAGAKLEHSGSHSSGHPLLLAAQRGNLEVLRMLIAAGPCWVDVRLTWSYHVDPSYPQVTNSYPHISPILRSKWARENSSISIVFQHSADKLQHILGVPWSQELTSTGQRTWATLRCWWRLNEVGSCTFVATVVSDTLHHKYP